MDWYVVSCSVRLAVAVHGLAVGPRRATAIADRLLYWLRGAGLPVLSDGFVRQCRAGGIGAVADGIALRPLCGGVPSILRGDLSDAGALHRIVDRLQHRRRNFRWVRAVHRDLSRTRDRQ